jgi:outer membrane protein
MKKTILVVLVAIFGATVVHAQLLAPQLKIGVVNSEQLYASYPEFKKAEAQLQKETEGWQSDRENWAAQMEKRQAGIADKESQLKAGETTFSEKKKKQLLSDIDSLKADLSQRYNQQMTFEQDRLQKRKAELLGSVLQVVNKAIEAVGEQDGYDFIIDASNGTVVYARNPEDLTDKILRHLKDK